MLAQAAERIEPRETGGERAVVYFPLVLWTREMAVEVVKGPESVVAEYTLIRRAIPRPLRGDILRFFATIGKESPRYGDHITRVVDPDPSVDHPAIGTGWARSALEVEYHCRLVDKELRATTVLECTRYIPWLMYAGFHVCTQVALRVEDTPTLDTVVMRLTVVLVQAIGTLEELVTSVAVVVFFDAMFFEFFVIVEVGITLATIVMSGALDVVLFETPPGIKVLVTIITDVVIGRV